MEHRREATATRIANLINRGCVGRKLSSHPLILSACRYIFDGDFKVSSLNAREALYNGGHQPLHADWKKPRPDFPKVDLVNTIWAIDDLSAANGAPRIIRGTYLHPGYRRRCWPTRNRPIPMRLCCRAGRQRDDVQRPGASHGGTRNRRRQQTTRTAWVIYRFVRIRRSRTSGAGSRRRRQVA